MAAVKAGDAIAWQTWCGEARALVLWVHRDGTCGLRAEDGHDEFHERVPSGAVVVAA